MRLSSSPGAAHGEAATLRSHSLPDMAESTVTTHGLVYRSVSSADESPRLDLNTVFLMPEQ